MYKGSDDMYSPGCPTLHEVDDALIVYEERTTLPIIHCGAKWIFSLLLQHDKFTVCALKHLTSCENSIKMSCTMVWVN